MLMVFGSRALREVSEPESVQVTGDSRKRCNEDFIDLRSAENYIYIFFYIFLTVHHVMILGK